MKTLHIIRFNQSCAGGEIVVRLNGSAKEYPTTLIVLDKIYRRRSWCYIVREIYYIQEQENVRKP